MEDGAQLLSLLPEDLQDQLKGSLIEVSKLKMQQSIGKGKVTIGLQQPNGGVNTRLIQHIGKGRVNTGLTTHW